MRKNLGIGVNTLARWKAYFSDNDDDILVIGSSSYVSKEEKGLLVLIVNYMMHRIHLICKKAVGIPEKD